MRLWSLHPKYLDRQGLTAVWREGLLAQAVLRGETKGYKNHPQLERFRATSDPLGAIGRYLFAIAQEAESRKYSFDMKKIIVCEQISLPVTHGQIAYEWQHLLHKLSIRSYERFIHYQQLTTPVTHPMFYCIQGGIASWEKPIINN